MPKEKILNGGEKMIGEEALHQEYAKLKQEVEKAQQELNEQQKEFAGEDRPTADFFGTQAMTEHKINRMKEIEEQLKKEKE